MSQSCSSTCALQACLSFSWSCWKMSLHWFSQVQKFALPDPVASLESRLEDRLNAMEQRLLVWESLGCGSTCCCTLCGQRIQGMLHHRQLRRRTTSRNNLPLHWVSGELLPRTRTLSTRTASADWLSRRQLCLPSRWRTEGVQLCFMEHAGTMPVKLS